MFIQAENGIRLCIKLSENISFARHDWLRILFWKPELGWILVIYFFNVLKVKLFKNKARSNTSNF